MIRTSTVASTVSSLIAHIAGISLARFRPGVAHRHVDRIDTQSYATAVAHFTARHPDWVAGLFDEHFLTHTGRTIVDEMAAGTLSRSQAVDALANAWDRQLGPASVAVRKRRIADAAAVSREFLAGFAGTATPAASIPAVEAATNDAAPVLRLIGVVDAAVVRTFLAQAATLHRENAPTITVDLSGVERLGVTGLYALHVVAGLCNGTATTATLDLESVTMPALRRLAEANLAYGRQASLRLVCPAGTLRTKLEQVGIFDVFSG